MHLRRIETQQLEAKQKQPLPLSHCWHCFYQSAFNKLYYVAGFLNRCKNIKEKTPGLRCGEHSHLTVQHFGNLFLILIRSYFSLPHLLIIGAISMSKKGGKPDAFLLICIFRSLCRDSHSAAAVRAKEYGGRSLIVRTSVRIITGEF